MLNVFSIPLMYFMTDAYKTTLVRIMGEDYPIKSDADSNYLHELARFVEERIVSVSSKNKFPPRLKREVLAALLIADDYFTEKKKNAELEKKQIKLNATVREALERELLLEP